MNQILTAIVFGLSLLLSYWAINAMVVYIMQVWITKEQAKDKLNIEIEQLEKRNKDKLTHAFNLDIAATFFWILFYYLTH